MLLAGITTLLLLPVGTALAWWIAKSQGRWRDIVTAVVSLPLVLPPTVLGFYLLVALGPFGPGGQLASLWGARTLAFSFEGLVIGSMVYSLPFMVLPLRMAFKAIGREPLEAGATLGASNNRIFWRIAVPLALPGFMSGAIMTFAHTLGEFGVVLMIGGNIPGETKVLSIAIYDFIERGQWVEAHIVSAGMVLFAYVVVTTAMQIQRIGARQ
ncbi:molybdate ABC transporter permease subunit [Devosia naphthalenivorans]|uniref:molybdate ABC transporter permease subunit n=1 Tax=Devosia naphthalenivorans TaxID=2082392 RepID=UPI000D3BFA9B|nr:molybdate ABC transporter permease subunit [Devosia naphthalenivorans]